MRRAIEGLFSDLGKRIRGSFGKLRLTMNRRDAVKAVLVVLGSARAGTVGPAVSTLIGTGSPGFTDREVNNPHGLTTGPDRRLYFCDLDNQRIRRLDLGTRQTITIAGDGQKAFRGDGGPAAEASLNMPHEINSTPRGTSTLPSATITS